MGVDVFVAIEVAVFGSVVAVVVVAAAARVEVAVVGAEGVSSPRGTINDSGGGCRARFEAERDGGITAIGSGGRSCFVVDVDVAVEAPLFV